MMKSSTTYFSKNKNNSITTENSKGKEFESEEWNEILRQVNLSPNELNIQTSNKLTKKLIEAIEILNKQIIEKNIQIRLINNENDNLNQKNSLLNKENIALAQKLFILKEKYEKDDRQNSDSSMVFNFLMISTIIQQEKQITKYLKIMRNTMMIFLTETGELLIN